MSNQPILRPVSPLRRRMLEDMAMRGLREETQRDYLRVVSGFAIFLGRAPDTATAEDIEESFLIFVRKGQLLRPKQMRLEELITVARVLASRGFAVSREGDGKDTLLPRNVWDESEANLIFDIFHCTAKRSEVRGCIVRSRLANSETIISLYNIDDFKNERQAFTTTSEWYVGELLVREFQALSSSYGVSVSHLTRPGSGGECGDFDVLSVMGDTSLYYVECKTGGFSRDEVRRMGDRCRALHCTTAVMMLGQGIDASALKSKLEMDHPTYSQRQVLMQVGIPSLPQSSVFKWGDLFFVNAGEEGGGIAKKLQTILRLVARAKWS